MKTEIFISGQINGNSTLRNAIITSECEMKREMFNAVTLIFPSKKAAYSALWSAYKYLRQDKEDARASLLSYSPKSSLQYDASIAKIIK